MTKVLSVILLFLSYFPCFGEEEQTSLPYLLILYGAPGSGRAGMAVRVRRDFNLPNISLPTLVATHVFEGTALGEKGRDFLGKGGSPPPELLFAMLCDRLKESDCAKGALLEDMSLTVGQVGVLQKQLADRFQLLVVNIDASDDWLVQKAGRRFVCHNCGYVCDDSETFHKEHNYCDICSSPLQRRQGDSPEAIRSRLEAYRSQLSPLFSFYLEKKVLIQVPGNREFDETYKALVGAIEARTGLVASKTKIESLPNESIP
jgi:adenylate kinase